MVYRIDSMHLKYGHCYYGVLDATLQNSNCMITTNEITHICSLIVKDCWCLVRGFSWFVANPFNFNVLQAKNDVGYIPRTSSPGYTLEKLTRPLSSHLFD